MYWEGLGDWLSKKLDIIDKRFGILTVLKFVKIDKGRNSMWLCKCDCGKEVIVRGSSLVCGNTKSCGCMRGCGSKHWLKYSVSKHGMAGTKFYKTYYKITARCNNKRNYSYKNYGGRGIKCLWSSFEEFYNDMYDSYLQHCEEFGESNTSIDRIDVNGDYSKENCRWATRKEQQNNKRTNHFIEVNGEIMTLAQVSDRYGVYYGTVVYRANNGKNVLGGMKK